MRWAWLCLVLAGCHSEGSLEVWVEPGEGMTVSEVELYVGIHDPHIGESIRPARGARAETVWWKRDPQNRDRDILQWDAEAASRGAVRYQFIPDGLDTVRALVAVGYITENGARKRVGVATYMHDAELGSGEIYRRYMTLGEFDELPRRDSVLPRPGVPGIQIWGPPDDPAACVQVDNADELNLGEYGAAASAMIVTPDDPDCDSFKVTEQPNKDECVPEEYNSVARRSRDSLSCLLYEPVGTGSGSANACVAGGPTCKDGPGEVACAPSTWCTPTALCGTVAGCNDVVCDDIPTATPHFNCSLFYDANTSRWCSGTRAVLTVANSFPGVECDPTRVTMMRKPTMPAWFETLVYGSIDEMWLTVAPKVQNLCEFELKASGPLQTTPMGLPRLAYPAAIALPLKKPVDGRGLIMPILLRGEPVAGCTELLGNCSLNSYSNDVGLPACLAAPINDPALRVP